MTAAETIQAARAQGLELFVDRITYSDGRPPREQVAAHGPNFEAFLALSEHFERHNDAIVAVLKDNG